MRLIADQPRTLESESLRAEKAEVEVDYLRATLRKVLFLNTLVALLTLVALILYLVVEGVG